MDHPVRGWKHEIEAPEVPGMFRDVARLYRERMAGRQHDEEQLAWLKENERSLCGLARTADDHVLDGADYAPAMADVLGYMTANEQQGEASPESLRARVVFLRAAERLYPQIAEQRLQPTKEGVLGTLEMAVSLLESGEYHQLADHLAVDIAHARRRSLGDMAKTLTTWRGVISRRLDGDAHAAFVELRHGQMDHDVAAEVRRELSFGVEAAYFLERMKDALSHDDGGGEPSDSDVEEENVVDLNEVKKEVGHSKAFMSATLGRMINISRLGLDGDAPRWQRLASGLKEIASDYKHDNNGALHKALYNKRVDDLLESLRSAA